MRTLHICPEDAPALAQCVATRSWHSRMDLKPEVLDMVAGELLARGWVSSEERHWIYLCLDEAVVNAMLHGNEGDASLHIEVSIGGDERSWVVTIRDQGNGFTLLDVPDPDLPSHLLLEHGRGIRIMQEWLDELRYYQNGTCTWMTRRRADVVRV
jgi:serine/threonine-protein kinase RsbW